VLGCCWGMLCGCVFVVAVCGVFLIVWGDDCGCCFFLAFFFHNCFFFLISLFCFFPFFVVFGFYFFFLFFLFFFFCFLCINQGLAGTDSPSILSLSSPVAAFVSSFPTFFVVVRSGPVLSSLRFPIFMGIFLFHVGRPFPRYSSCLGNPLPRLLSFFFRRFPLRDFAPPEEPWRRTFFGLSQFPPRPIKYAGPCLPHEYPPFLASLKNCQTFDSFQPPSAPSSHNALESFDTVVCPRVPSPMPLSRDASLIFKSRGNSHLRSYYSLPFSVYSTPFVFPRFLPVVEEY